MQINCQSYTGVNAKRNRFTFYAKTVDSIEG